MTFEALPSIAWLFMAAVPFAYQAQYFPPAAAVSQGIGIGVVSLALAAGDLFATHGRANERLDDTGGGQNLVLAALAVFVFALPVIHVLYAHDIPVMHLFGGSAEQAEVSAARENFSKLLDAPAPLKIMFNWVIVVAGPVLAAILFYRRKFIQFALVVAWCCAYAIVSSARLPVLLFAATTSVAIVGTAFPRLARPLVAAGLLGLAGLNVAAIYRGEDLMAGYELSVAEGTFHAPLTANLPISPGDVERMNGDQFDVRSSFGPLDPSLYRSFLGPMEVANRWYVYFPEVSGGWRPLTDLAPVARAVDWVHTSNRVARWAYFERFPTRYLESAHAYAAIDADAYAFGGLWGTALAALGLLLLRLGIAVLRVRTASNHVFYYIGIALLSALPFQASLQAIMGPNGLIVVILGLLFTWFAYGQRKGTG